MNDDEIKKATPRFWGGQERRDGWERPETGCRQNGTLRNRKVKEGSMLKKLIRTVRYLAATARVCFLEADLTQHKKIGEGVRDPAILSVLQYRHEETSRDLARARAAWTAFYPPGVRFTWRQA